MSKDLQSYRLEVSTDGRSWRVKAGFLEGEPSLFSVPFDANVAVLEAKAFKEFWAAKGVVYNYVRIVMDI